MNCSWVTFPFISHGSDALLLILLLLYKEFSVSVFIQPTIFQEMHNLDIFFSCFMWKYVYVCVGGGGVGKWEGGDLSRAFRCLVVSCFSAMLSDTLLLKWFD